MNKKQVARVLEEIAELLELKGESPFKSRAYSNGARIIERMDGSIHDAVVSGELGNMKGIGKALNEKVTELVLSGKLKYYDELKKEIPAGLIEMLDIPGLGPKKIRVVHDTFGITEIEELRKLCEEDKLAELKGFGKKTQLNILRGIEFRSRHAGRSLYADVVDEANALLEQVLSMPEVDCAELAGSLRRARETIKDIDVVAASTKPTEVMQAFVSLPSVLDVIAQGETKSSIMLDSGVQADLRVVPKEKWPYTLHHFTGSKEHNTLMRSRAKKQGMKLNEYGLFLVESDELVPCEDEEAIFSKLGLKFIPPELREGMQEIEVAETKEAPPLVNVEDIAGVFHVHTTYSDGGDTLEDMVQAARKLGLKYLGIADHSQSAFYANGLKEDDIRKQHDEIDKLQAEYDDIKIYKGIESDILKDGALDYSDEVLASFDYIVGSIHSRFNMSREAMTERIVRAIQNPYITILGHPTGRLLLARDPFEVDMDAMLQACAENNVLVEINANPHRLDLDWRYMQQAKAMGAKFVINPDAHSTEGINHYRYGVYVARKGMLTADDVFNTAQAPIFAKKS